MLDVQTAYNMSNEHLVQALRCENLGPKSQMLLDTIESLVDEGSDREGELLVDLEAAQEELKSMKPYQDAEIDDVATTVALLTCLEENEFTDPDNLVKILKLLNEHEVCDPDKLEKLLVAVKVLQELKEDD